MNLIFLIEIVLFNKLHTEYLFSKVLLDFFLIYSGVIWLKNGLSLKKD